MSVAVAADTKWCGRCHRHLPLMAFWANRWQPDGLQHYCKRCLKAPGVRPYDGESTMEPLHQLGRAMLQRALKEAQGIDVAAPGGHSAEWRKHKRDTTIAEAQQWLRSLDLLYWLDILFEDERNRQEALVLIDDVLEKVSCRKSSSRLPSTPHAVTPRR